MDHIAAPPLTDPVTDPKGCIEYLIGKLPPELHDASFWWQFTSSQSLPGSEDTLSARLWGWSTVPLTDAELTRWAAAANRDGKVIDPVLYRAVQPHYIASPIFEGGMTDPLPRRYGVRQGLEDEVVLVIPPPDPKNPEMVSGQGYEPGRGVQAYLDEIGGGRGFREPIVSAIASYIAIYGSKADCTKLKAAICKAIDKAEAGGPRRTSRSIATRATSISTRSSSGSATTTAISRRRGLSASHHQGSTTRRRSSRSTSPTCPAGLPAIVVTAGLRPRAADQRRPCSRRPVSRSTSATPPWFGFA